MASMDPEMATKSTASTSNRDQERERELNHQPCYATLRGHGNDIVVTLFNLCCGPQT